MKPQQEDKSMEW